MVDLQGLLAMALCLLIFFSPVKCPGHILMWFKSVLRRHPVKYALPRVLSQAKIIDVQSVSNLLGPRSASSQRLQTALRYKWSELCNEARIVNGAYLLC